jgi:hypothetical protein
VDVVGICHCYWHLLDMRQAVMRAWALMVRPALVVNTYLHQREEREGQ